MSQTEHTPASVPAADPERVTPWNFRQAGQLDAEQQAVLGSFQERLAVSLTAVFTAHVRTPVPVSSAGACRIGFRSWVEQAQAEGPRYLAVLGVGAMHALFSLDARLALAMIDVALGGPGEPVEPPREPTSIEERMLAAAAGKATQALQTEWPPELGVSFTFTGQRSWTMLAGLMPAEEKSLVLTFAVQCGKVTGQAVWVLPANQGTALLRTLLQPVAQRPAMAEEAQGVQKQRLRNMPFVLELVLPPVRIEMGKLLSLRAETVLELPLSVSTPANLKVAGRLLGEAQPIRQDQRRAALIQKVRTHSAAESAE